MPLTALQKVVARLLASHRNPESHVAGGAVINRTPDSPPYSSDLDIFHDIAASVAASAETDGQVLQAAGYQLEWLLRGPTLFRAEATRGAERLRLDWTADSAFRFFPVQADEEFGYCLHPADLATNKVLALAGRDEIRDFLDMLWIDQTYLSLGAVVWAACGKDEGYTPRLLLDQANHHARFREADLRTESLARPLDLRELKQQWLLACSRAQRLVEELPAAELGCLYLRGTDQPVTPDVAHADFTTLTRHRGSVRGAWPTLS